MQLRRLITLSLVHLVTDCYTVFAPTLWLPLKVAFDLDGAQVGLLLALGLIPASVLQPIYGAVSDRYDAKWLVAIGPLLLVVCYSLLGLSTFLPLTFLLLLVGAAGAGMFHPEAATLAGRFGAAASSKAMMLFIAAGFIGQTIGPYWISWSITGSDRTFADTWRTIFPGLAIVAIGVVMVARLPHVQLQKHTGCRGSMATVLAGRQRSVWSLVAMNITRWIGLQLFTFTIPLYLLAQYGQPANQDAVQRSVGLWMSLFLAGHGVGIVLGGLLGPAHRERFIILTSMAVALLPAWLLPFVHDGLAMVMLSATGLCVGWTIPVAIQLGQSIVPGGERWISGMLIGFSWGVGAVICPPLAGFLCDTFSAKLSLVAGALALTASVAMAASIPGQAELNRLKSDIR